jgi:hypothetical protein
MIMDDKDSPGIWVEASNAFYRKRPWHKTHEIAAAIAGVFALIAYIALVVQLPYLR